MQGLSFNGQGMGKVNISHNLNGKDCSTLRLAKRPHAAKTSQSKQYSNKILSHRYHSVRNSRSVQYSEWELVSTIYFYDRVYSNFCQNTEKGLKPVLAED
ncbi:hypothetical protein CEXT_634081 [Caerostris extrusa]|uniref:Uncharacterized protein n=1 Tax=Caerostris extrusa TaxID=172846 RepID=A0AAV4RDS9_CAEEX|nr:hypothetical protein CEXT_634081 [Caerostris extrusa]